MKAVFVLGIKQAPRIEVPPGVQPPPAKFLVLAEEVFELDQHQAHQLNNGYISLAFPIKALAIPGVDPRVDQMEVRVSMPGVPSPIDADAVAAILEAVGHVDEQVEADLSRGVVWLVEQGA